MGERCAQVLLEANGKACAEPGSMGRRARRSNRAQASVSADGNDAGRLARGARRDSSRLGDRLPATGARECFASRSDAARVRGLPEECAGQRSQRPGNTADPGSNEIAEGTEKTEDFSPQSEQR